MTFTALLNELERGGAIDIDAAFATIMDGHTGHDEMEDDFLRSTVPHMRDAAWIAAGARALRRGRSGHSGSAAWRYRRMRHRRRRRRSAQHLHCRDFRRRRLRRGYHQARQSGDEFEIGRGGCIGGPRRKANSRHRYARRALREAGVTFLFAQNHHPAMRVFVAAPQANWGAARSSICLARSPIPREFRRQLVGVFSGDFVEPTAAALKQLGAEQAVVVHGAGGIDELTFVDANGDDRAAFLSVDGGVRPLNNIDVVALSRENLTYRPMRARRYAAATPLTTPGRCAVCWRGE